MANKKHIMMGVGGVLSLAVAYAVVQHLRFISTDNAQIHAHTVLLAPKVAGLVVKVQVDEGQQVKEGDVLVELDDRDYQNTLKQVRGELSSIEARKEDAERNFHRVENLIKNGALSQQQFDAAHTTVSELRAKAEAISAQLAQAELNVQHTHIKAPSDGFIAKRSVEVGQLAAAGVPLLGFVDARERWVEANFKETDIADIKVGAAVNVEVDAVDGKKFHGKVSSLSAATGSTFTLLPPDNATGNFTKVVQRVPVRIVLQDLTPEEIQSLRAGLSAVVNVHR